MAIYYTLEEYLIALDTRRKLLALRTNSQADLLLEARKDQKEKAYDLKPLSVSTSVKGGN